MDNLTSGKKIEIINNCVPTNFWYIDNIDMVKSKWMEFDNTICVFDSVFEMIVFMDNISIINHSKLIIQ